MIGVVFLACDHCVVEYGQTAEYAGRAALLREQRDFQFLGVAHIFDDGRFALLLHDARSDCAQSEQCLDQLGALCADKPADAENLAAVQMEADVLE